MDLDLPPEEGEELDPQVQGSHPNQLRREARGIGHHDVGEPDPHGKDLDLRLAHLYAPTQSFGQPRLEAVCQLFWIEEPGKGECGSQIKEGQGEKTEGSSPEPSAAFEAPWGFRRLGKRF
jgi:hypothetical protein